MPTPTIGNKIIVAAAADAPQKQFFPTVAALADGSFAVAWGGDNGVNISARYVSADGTVVTDLPVPSGSGFLNNPPIADRIEAVGLPSGDVAFVFMDGDIGPNSNQMSVLLASPHHAWAESIAGIPQQMNGDPFIWVKPDGTLEVGYSTQGGDIKTVSYFQGLNPVYGTVSGNADVTLDQASPIKQGEAASSNAGRHVITYFSSIGEVKLSAEQAAGPDATAFVASGAHPHIAHLAGGGFVVAMEGTSNNVLFRVFEEDGVTARTAAITVDGDNAAQAHVTALQDGRFMMVWRDKFIPGGIFEGTSVMGRIYNANGSADTDAFTIEHRTAVKNFASTGAPRAVELHDGRVVVTYQDGLDADSDIDAKIIDPRKAGVEVVGTIHNDDYFGSAFADTFMLGAGHDNVHAGAGDDTLYGDAGNDGLYAGDGNDVLVGGLGNDSLNGDEGIDTVSYAQAKGAVFADLATHVATGDGTDNIQGVENLIGGLFDDHLNGTDGANMLDGDAGKDTLKGAGGDDRLVGGLGDDDIDGGAGIDTAVYSHKAAEYQVQHSGEQYKVIGPDGTDTLLNVEKLEFADGVVALSGNSAAPNAPGEPTFAPTPGGHVSGLFDTEYYLAHNPDVAAAGISALDHFNTAGWHEGRNPNAWFDVKGYVAANPDVAASGLNPLDHYHQIGWHQGRDPGANFDTKLYLIHNPDVAVAGVDPLEHYLQYGINEGRAAYAAIGEKIAGGFDAEWYLFHNPDVAAAGIDPLAHFKANGWHEGRNPNAVFDTNGYLAHYADVAAAGMNPLDHYMQSGWHEGRDPSASFDTAGYLAANPDVAAAGINPLEHFMTSGIYEGRQAVNDGLWH